MGKRPLIGELLVEQGVLTRAQLEEALELQSRLPMRTDLTKDIPLVDLMFRPNNPFLRTPQVAGENPH
jgi:hypothetical protein